MFAQRRMATVKSAMATVRWAAVSSMASRGGSVLTRREWMKMEDLSASVRTREISTRSGTALSEISTQDRVALVSQKTQPSVRFVISVSERERVARPEYFGATKRGSRPGGTTPMER